MPRKPPNPRTDEPLEGELLPSESIPYGGRGTGHQHLIDPLAPLPGGIQVKLVREQRPKVSRGEKDSNQVVYRDYLRNLVRYNGDGPTALSKAMGIDLDEAESKFPELHDKIIRSATARSVGEVLKEMDLHKEARLEILKQHAYGSVPAASLKALDMISEMDSIRSQDASSYESYIRAVVDKKKSKQQ